MSLVKQFLSLQKASVLALMKPSSAWNSWLAENKQRLIGEAKAAGVTFKAYLKTAGAEWRAIKDKSRWEEMAGMGGYDQVGELLANGVKTEDPADYSPSSSQQSTNEPSLSREASSAPTTMTMSNQPVLPSQQAPTVAEPSTIEPINCAVPTPSITIESIQPSTQPIPLAQEVDMFYRSLQRGNRRLALEFKTAVQNVIREYEEQTL